MKKKKKKSVQEAHLQSAKYKTVIYADSNRHDLRNKALIQHDTSTASRNRPLLNIYQHDISIASLKH